MAIHSSLRLLAARRNVLAACLAAALAAGGAVAGSTSRSADAPRLDVSSDEAIFGALHTTRVSGAQNWPSNAGGSPAVPTSPADITVANCNDNGQGSLRQAFLDAVAGDVIDLRTLTCSTITLTSGAILAPVPNLSVLGPGEELLTVQADDTSRVFLSKYYGLEISDLTIAHGGNNAGDGGCIYVAGDLILTRTTVTDCRAGDGSNIEGIGGGAQVGGNLTMQSSTISASRAVADSFAFGGGARVQGTATLRHSTIEGNTAMATLDDAFGGGLLAEGSVDLYGSHVTGNAARSTDGRALGGGLHSAPGVRATLSTISGNSAHSDTTQSYGGGIHGGAVVFLSVTTLSDNTASTACYDCGTMGGGASAFGPIAAQHSVIRDNQVLSTGSESSAGGGGLATFAQGYAGRILLTNSTVSGNSARCGVNGNGYGGGIAAIFGSSFYALNSTIAFNYASHSGGGATGNVAVTYGESYAPTLHNSIVANNDAPDGADIAQGLPFSSFTVEGNNNLVMAVGVGVTLPDDTIIIDPHLLALTNSNGGLTATHALAADSPAIDAGVATNLVFDQRLCPYWRTSGFATDIGAFELQTELADFIFGDDFEGGLPPSCP
jgi:hypothetical protein